MATAAESDTFDADVRLALFQHIADTAQAPSAEQLATTLGRSREEVEEAFRRLADAHVIVLAPGTSNVWMAAPFSAVPTPFRVEVNGRTYWGNCIWDALAIPAALGADAAIIAGCGDCGEQIGLVVRDGALTESAGVVHFAVPARRWWENIGYT